jgi:hypothetical protein
MLEQVAAVVPISILLVTVMGIFFGAYVEVGFLERVLAFKPLAIAALAIATSSFVMKCPCLPLCEAT